MKKIKHCLGCNELLVIGVNIVESRFNRSDYKCFLCRKVQMGSFSKTLPIAQQFAHGMKMHRVKLNKQINSLTGKVGRPPKLITELRLFLKQLNKTIKHHEKK